MRFNKGYVYENALHNLCIVSFSFCLFKKTFDGMSAKYLELINESFLIFLAVKQTIYHLDSSHI